MTGMTVTIPTKKYDFSSGEYMLTTDTAIKKSQFNTAVKKLKSSKLVFSKNVFMVYGGTNFFNGIDDLTIGTVLRYNPHKNNIIVDGDLDNPAFRLFSKFIPYIKEDKILAIPIFSMDEYDHKVSIARFELIAHKSVIANISPNKEITVKLPMGLSPDKDGKYFINDKQYYTNRELSKIYNNKSNGIKRLIDCGVCYLFHEVGENTLTIGMVRDYNITEGTITVLVDTTNPYTADLVNNLDSIGTNIFARLIMDGKPKSSGIMFADGTQHLTNEIEISAVYGFILDIKKGDDNNG